MDFFEEFEFKPLSDGLGFHKKAESIKQEIQSSRLSEDKVSRVIPNTPPASMLRQATPPAQPTSERELNEIDFDNPRQASQSMRDLLSSLPAGFDFVDESFEPQPQAQANRQARPSAEAMELPKKHIPEARQLLKQVEVPSPNFKNTLGTRAWPVAPTTESTSRERTAATATLKTPSEVLTLKPAASSFSAAMFDAIAVFAISSICLSIVLFITKVDLLALLSHGKTDLSTLGHLAMLWFFVLNLYMLTSRTFFGSTAGEWLFDLQLGNPSDQRKATYPLRVLWRMALSVATGFILLPVLSKIFRRDLAATLGGPQLYQVSLART